MIEETLHAANWWVKKIISYNISVEAPSWQSHFEKVMTELLRAKYHNHWYKDEPLRGSGYRAISNEYSLDPILDKAARAVSHSLPKNLARMVLTSDDRWLVMFVNPGEVTIRDKQYQEDVIYDKINHIYNSSLKNKSSNLNNKYNSKLSKSRSSLSSNSSYSKSDDETLSTLDENKCDDNNITKSDGEDSGTPNKNNKDENGNIDYRKLFLQNIHNAARRNKEKEIEAHVQAYKEEMRENHNKHRKKFGAYDDEDNKYYKSPSKSSTTGSTTNTTSTSSPSRTPSKPSSNIREQKRSRSHSPRSPPNDHEKDDKNDNDDHREDKDQSARSENKPSQIFNVLNSLTLSKLNGFNHRNGISIDMNTSNYGKHLKQILNQCKIHSRNQLQNDHKINNNKHKNGTILNNHHNTNTKNGKINNNNNNNNDYMLSMNGEYPILVPMSFASPSPSISPMITPSPSPLDLDLNDGPQQLKHSKSQPITMNNHRYNNYQPLQKMKSMGPLNAFELHMAASSDEDDDEYPEEIIFNKHNNKQSESYHEHEEDQNSEIAMNTNASSPIYDSSSPQFLQNEMQNASPSSHGSKLAMQDLDLDGCEDLKY